MNKKGNIGDFVVSVTVFIGVIVIMAFFVIFSTGLFGINTVKGKLNAAAEGDIRIDNMNLLADEITIDGHRMSVLEAHLNASNSQDYEKVAKWEKFEQEIKELIPNNGCLFLYSGIDVSTAQGMAFNNTDGRITDAEYSISEIERVSSAIPVEIVDRNGKQTSLAYMTYRGECP